MRIIAAADWTPKPGHIVDWVPTPRTLHSAATAPAHPVGPSFLQGDHIASVLAQRGEGRVHRGYTCSVVTVDSDLDIDSMTRALTEFLDAHEGLRSSFRVVDQNVIRYVVPAEDVELMAVDVESVDPIAHLDQRLPTDAVFDAFPGCVFGAVVRPNSFDLYFGVDHAFGDGSSQVLGTLEILARYGQETTHPTVARTHGSYVDYARAEHNRAATVTADSTTVRLWESALSAAGGAIPRFPLPLGLDNDEPQPVGTASVQLADAATAEQLSDLAKSHGAGLSAALFAAIAITERMLSGRDRYTVATVLSTRGRGEHLLSQGWYCNFAPVAFDIAGDSIDEVIPAAADALAAAKAAAADPVHAAMGILIGSGVIDPSVVTSPQMVTYMDFRWFPAPSGAHDLAVFTGQGRTRNASLWLSRDENGLYVGSQIPDNPIAAESVSRYFYTLRQVISSAVDADPGTTVGYSADDRVAITTQAR